MPLEQTAIGCFLNISAIFNVVFLTESGILDKSLIDCEKLQVEPFTAIFVTFLFYIPTI